MARTSYFIIDKVNQEFSISNWLAATAADTHINNVKIARTLSVLVEGRKDVEQRESVSFSSKKRKYFDVYQH